MEEATVVRQNLMDDPNYRPYCGSLKNCRDMPKAERTKELQFKCPNCGWVSTFPQDFIDKYKTKHKL